MEAMRTVDRIGVFLVPATEEQKLNELAHAAKEAMYEPGEGWRDSARKLFEALNAAAVARRIIEGNNALAASAAFEEQVARQAGRRWIDLFPRERRHAVAELLAKKTPAQRKDTDEVSLKALAEHVSAVSQVLGEKAPATAGLWIETDPADPKSTSDDAIDDRPSGVSAEESLRLLRDWQEESNINRLLRGPLTETETRLRLCHIAAKLAANAHRLITRARGNDDSIAKARQDANTLLVERASACDESSRISHIEAIRALQEFLAERAPDIYEWTGIYTPTSARALLDTILKLEPELIDAIDAQVPGGGAAEPVARLVDSLRRAVSKRRAFAIILDDTLL